MSERYPDDATLLALSEDEATGVQYIPTGRSPYYLEFRKLLHRLLRATERANDLRVYEDGDLSVGVRGGRATVHNQPIGFAGVTGIGLATSATTHLWLDAEGQVNSGTDGFPEDRSSFVPLAEVVTGMAAIESITDLRGEAFLAVPNLETLGVEPSAAKINQALEGISDNVTAEALSILTEGHHSSADSLHRHLGVIHDLDDEGHFQIINNSDGGGANVALRLALPNVQATDTVLALNRDNGYLQQRFFGVSYNLLGSVQPQYTHSGTLSASQSAVLIGAVPADGVVTDVILSVGGNIESSDNDDGIAASVRVNGSALTDTHPTLKASDGPGFASTGQGDGTAAIIVADGTELVTRGDVLTLDLTRTATGTISAEASDVVVMVVVRVNGPE